MFVPTDDDDAFLFTSPSKPGSQSASGAPTPVASQVPSPAVGLGVAGRGIKSRNSSFTDMLVNIPGSVTSTTSLESCEYLPSMTQYNTIRLLL